MFFVSLMPVGAFARVTREFAFEPSGRNGRLGGLDKTVLVTNADFGNRSRNDPDMFRLGSGRLSQSAPRQCYLQRSEIGAIRNRIWTGYHHSPPIRRHRISCDSRRAYTMSILPRSPQAPAETFNPVQSVALFLSAFFRLYWIAFFRFTFWRLSSPESSPDRSRSDPLMV